ncbi:MAG: hypothetical protein LBG62_01035 [Candidatus Methanoplasma sp.]|jgi:hypothetical protein|nr:hypothetical protein [Candidatus Methanoplasma sp.]
MGLEERVEGQMKGNMSLSEKIALHVPIYKGYRQKNLRRDEDRAIRQEVARSLENAKTDLATVQRGTAGSLELMRDAERVRSKADKYCIDVKKAAGGYSGLHDSVKILESELDCLISWDARLIDGAVVLKEQTAAAIRAIDRGDADLKATLREIEKTIDALMEAYSERETVMRGFKE